MDKFSRRKNVIIGVLCAIILIFTTVIQSDMYKRTAWGTKHVITVGAFSDSYWEVQNGYSYYILNNAIQRFEEQYPNVKVRFESGIMKEDYSEWLAEKMLSGDTPDVFFVLPDDFNGLAELGALKDLSDFTAGDSTFDDGQFYDSAYAYGQLEGVQFALPYECAPKLMFVNKSILDREDIAMPEKDWTWNDFYEICSKVTKDTDGDGEIDQFGEVGYSWRDAFTSNGVELFNQDGTQCYLAGENTKKAVTFMDRLEECSGGVNVGSRDFDKGNVAFQPMSFSEYRAYKSYPLSVKKYSGFEWECIPMPSGPNGDNISSLDTLMVAMNRNTKNAKYAWEFMKILTYDKEIQSEIFKYSEGASVLKSVTDSDEAPQELGQHIDGSGILDQQILSDAIENAAVAPRFRNYDYAVVEIDRAINEIIEGQSNIGTELIIWNRSINRKLKNSGW